MLTVAYQFEIGQVQDTEKFAVLSQLLVFLMNSNINCFLGWTKQFRSRKSKNTVIDANTQTFTLHLPLHSHVEEIPSLQDLKFTLQEITR